jgi:zinc protease
MKVLPKLSLSLLLLAALSSVSAAATQKVHEYQLDNGMKIIVKPDQRAPIAVAQIWYKVGSSYEHVGITGVSHVLEHMMFKGTKNLGPNEFSEIISANGGRENAFTGRDYTAYFQTLASDRLDVSFKLEADRMQNLLLNEDEFKKEVEVVKEERRLRTEDQPTSLAFERFKSAVFTHSPYRNPVIGWMADLDNLKLQDLQDWYEEWYSPANALLVVVGDVDPDKIHQQAKETYGKVPARKVRALRKPLPEPELKNQMRMTISLPAKQPYLIMGYKTPSIGFAEHDWEPYALEVMSAILDGGDSARFSRELVRGNEIAASADADYSAFNRLPDMFLLDGTPTDKHSIADLEQAFRQQIKRLQEQPVTQQELDRVITQVVAAKVYELDSVFYQAMQIGMLETIGHDWRLLDRYTDNLRAVTAEQVQQVARRYLTDDNLYVAVLNPLPMDEQVAARKPVAIGGHHGG